MLFSLNMPLKAAAQAKVTSAAPQHTNNSINTHRQSTNTSTLKKQDTTVILAMKTVCAKQAPHLQHKMQK